MFMTFKQLSPIRFILYTIVQTAGAFIGSLLTYLVYADAINRFDGGIRRIDGAQATAGIFASYPSVYLGWWNGLLDQVSTDYPYLA